MSSLGDDPRDGGLSGAGDDSRDDPRDGGLSRLILIIVYNVEKKLLVKVNA